MPYIKVEPDFLARLKRRLTDQNRPVDRLAEQRMVHAEFGAAEVE